MSTKIGLAVYTPHDWSRLLAKADDADALDSSWKEWRHKLKEIKNRLIMEGFDVVEISIDLDALDIYCQTKGLRNNAASRSQYVADLLEQRENQEK